MSVFSLYWGVIKHYSEKVKQISHGKKSFQEDNSINSLDDIVFEYRNKDYGVYQLRKKYKRHLLSGFLIAFLIFGGAIAYPIIEAYSLKYRVVRHVSQSREIVFDSFDEPDMPMPPPPPPPVALKVR